MEDQELFKKKVINNLKTIKSDELLLLKGHLFIEQAIDNGIIIALGEKCFKELGLPFLKKLILSEGLQKSDDLFSFQSIKSLNLIRNKLAHDAEYEIKGDLINWIKKFNHLTEDDDISQNMNAYIRAIRMSIIFIIGYLIGRNEAYATLNNKENIRKMAENL